jgi:hypothetical protein
VPQSHVATRGLVELVCFSEPLIYTGKARCLFSKICPLICIYSLIMAFGYHGSRKLLPHCAGHVARMPMSRAPRQLLTGWMAHPRPIGCPGLRPGAQDSAEPQRLSRRLRAVERHRSRQATVAAADPRHSHARPSEATPSDAQLSNAQAASCKP